jgi:hypothetical protein
MNKPEYLPEKLTDEQINSICLSFRHDFLLDSIPYEGVLSSGMTDVERIKLRMDVKEMYHAIRKEVMYIETPLCGISDESLYAEFQRRKLSEEILELRNLDLNGITVKDFVVCYGRQEFVDEISYKFAPFTKNPDGTLEFGYHTDKIESHEWGHFFPKGFSEEEECIYTYAGALSEALELLKQCGIETRQDDEFFEDK